MKRDEPLNSQDDQALFDEIHKLYHLEANELPSETMDNEILAMARAANIAANDSRDNAVKDLDDKRRPVSFWLQYRLPLSSAAGVLLVVTLWVTNPALKQESEREMYDAPMPAMMQQSAPPRASLALDSALNSTSEPQAERVTNDEVFPAVMDNQQGQAAKAQSVKAMSPSLKQPSLNQQALNQESFEQQALKQQSFKQQLAKPQSASAGIVEQSQLHINTSPNAAISELEHLIKMQQWPQAQAYYQALIIRYPEMLTPAHPDYQRLHKLLQQLPSTPK